MEPILLPNQPTVSTSDAQTETENHAAKQPFIAPKLSFIKPKLTRQGSVEAITADGFFEPTPVISPGG